MEKFILFAPLIGSLIAGFGWRAIGEKAAQYLTTGILFLGCALSWYVFLTYDGVTQHIPVLDWVVTGDFRAEWSIRIDRLTAIMLIVVNTVSALVGSACALLIPDPALDTILAGMNGLFSVIFLLDFLYRARPAESFGIYFVRGFGWADLLSCLPVPQLKLLRLFRL